MPEVRFAYNLRKYLEYLYIQLSRWGEVGKGITLVAETLFHDRDSAGAGRRAARVR